MNQWAMVGVHKDNYTNPKTVGDIYNVKFVKKIIEACGNEFGITLDIKSTVKMKPFILAKQLAIYFIREKLKYSWKLIALITGQDHSTAIYSHKTIKGFIDIDKNFKSLAERIDNDIAL